MIAGTQLVLNKYWLKNHWRDAGIGQRVWQGGEGTGGSVLVLGMK
jgi:hypothetical protein